MKYLVETTGAFHLYDVELRVAIRHVGFTVVEADATFTQRHLSNGNLSILEQLTDEPTDEEWVLWLKESAGNLDLARDSFVSKYTIHPAKAPTTQSETATSKKSNSRT